MRITKHTPILIVDAIEPLLQFWTETMGYKNVAEVPHDNRIGFVMLDHDGQTLMLQTEASIKADLKNDTYRGLNTGSVCVYVDVDSIDEAVAIIEKSGATILAGPRETAYGAKEIFAIAPGGFVFAFAHHQ